MKLISFLSISLFLFSCSSTSNKYTFDGSSANSVQESIKYYSNSLSEVEQKKFMAAIMQVAFDGIDLNPHSLPFKDKGVWDIVARKNDGLSYREVLDLASTSSTKVTLEFK